VVNADLDGVGDAGGELGGDVGQGGGDLGGEGLGERRGGVVLGLEGVLDGGDLTGLDDEVGLAVEGGDDTLDLVGQVLDGAGEGQGISVGKVVAAVDGLDGAVDAVDERVGGALDAGGVAAAVAVDGSAERVDLGGDALDDLSRRRLALGRGSNGSGGQSQSEQASELHGAGGLFKVCKGGLLSFVCI